MQSHELTEEQHLQLALFQTEAESPSSSWLPADISLDHQLSNRHEMEPMSATESRFTLPAYRWPAPSPWGSVESSYSASQSDGEARAATATAESSLHQQLIMAQMCPESLSPEQRAVLEAASDSDPCQVFTYPYQELGCGMAQAEEMLLVPVQHMSDRCSHAVNIFCACFAGAN